MVTPPCSLGKSETFVVVFQKGGQYDFKLFKKGLTFFFNVSYISAISSETYFTFDATSPQGRAAKCHRFAKSSLIWEDLRNLCKISVLKIRQFDRVVNISFNKIVLFYFCLNLVLKWWLFRHFLWGKSWLQGFAPCKSIDILQLCLREDLPYQILLWIFSNCDNFTLNFCHFYP